MVPFYFGYEGGVFRDVLVQVVPFHFEVLYFYEGGFLRSGGDKGRFEPFFEFSPQHVVVFIFSADHAEVFFDGFDLGFYPVDDLCALDVGQGYQSSGVDVFDVWFVSV